MDNLDMIRSGKGIPPIGFGIGTMKPTTIREKPNTEKSKGLSIDVSIKNTEEFKLLVNVFKRIITDERIDKQIRQDYLHEFIDNVGD